MKESALETASAADFYRALLGLSAEPTIRELIETALRILVQRTGVTQALIEILDEEAGDDGSHVASFGCEDGRVMEIRGLVSRGIMAATLAEGRTMLTTNAAGDPRFMAFESVRLHQLKAVLCAPVGRDTPVGVIYVQGEPAKDDPMAYAQKLREDVELCARALAPPTEWLLAHAPASASVAQSTSDDPFAPLRGRSRAFGDIVERLRLASPLDIHVLLTGPSGVGKTALAGAIHLASRRRARRFVEINCAAIPDALLENELFGAERGGHSAVPTGGVKGKVEAAQGGTLFLDEVAELSLGAQAKLLQLLQNKTYYRLGGSEPKHADVRVLAATNGNLKGLVLQKRFREDLYFRLKVLEVHVPSLAERPEDLVPLSIRFLREAVERHELSRKTMAPSAFRAIQTAEWPGNVRELAHRIESAALAAHLRASDWVEGRDIFPETEVSDGEPVTLNEGTRRFQRRLLLDVLQSTDWNIVETGRALDVSRSHVYNLIKTFDLKRT